MTRTRIRCCVQNCCDRSGAGRAPAHPFKRWLFAGLEVKGTQGPHTEEKEIEHPWCDVFNRCELFLHARLSAGQEEHATTLYHGAIPLWLASLRSKRLS